MMLTPFAGPALLALAGILPAPTALPPPPKAVATAVAGIQRDLAAGALANRKGLEHGRQDLAEHWFRTAATDYTRALVASRRLLQGDAALDEQVHPLQVTALHGRANALFSVAYIEMARTSLLTALADVNLILAEEPDNATALALRRDIAIAANHDSWDGVALLPDQRLVVPVHRR